MLKDFQDVYTFIDSSGGMYITVTDKLSAENN